MKKTLGIFLFFLPLIVWADENVYSISQQAGALWEAQDYTEASHLYEQLLPLPLPDWQHSRILYNLGTLKLVQHQMTEALDFFQKVVPIDLSLPLFGRDLFFNQGIGYLQYAQVGETIDPSSSALDQQILYIEQSLQAFKQAQALDCQVQHTEDDNTSCHPYAFIDQWIKAAHLQLHAFYQQQSQKWMERASTETLINVLDMSLQKFRQDLENFQNQNKNIAVDSSLFSYFHQQLETFFPIWNILQQREFLLDHKKSFEQAANFYLQALQALKQKDLSSTLKNLEQTQKSLVPFTFKDNTALQQAYLNYSIILLQETLSAFNLKKLMTQFDQLQVEKDQALFLEKIKNTLQMSLAKVQNQHLMQARFFLVTGFSQVESLIKQQPKTAQLILKQGIDQARRSLQLFLLAELMEEDASKTTQIQDILKNQQKTILKRVSPFISTVLDEQMAHYQQSKPADSNCQQFPWDQVIPLFDHGLQAAQNVEKQLNQSLLNSQDIVAKQKQTLKKWQQALHLLLHPPQQNSSSSVTNDPSSSMSYPQNLTETFRLIQEMYLQDQSQPEQRTRELHSW